MNTKPEDYKYYHEYDLIDSFKAVKNPEEWEPCQRCGVIPMVWLFDNGRTASCKCHNSKYDHFFVRAESIMSVVKRCSGSTMEYTSDALCKNWNHFVTTGEHLFPQNTTGTDLW